MEPLSPHLLLAPASPGGLDYHPYYHYHQPHHHLHGRDQQQEYYYESENNGNSNTNSPLMFHKLKMNFSSPTKRALTVIQKLKEDDDERCYLSDGRSSLAACSTPLSTMNNNNNTSGCGSSGSGSGNDTIGTLPTLPTTTSTTTGLHSYCSTSHSGHDHAIGEVIEVINVIIESHHDDETSIGPAAANSIELASPTRNAARRKSCMMSQLTEETHHDSYTFSPTNTKKATKRLLLPSVEDDNAINENNHGNDDNHQADSNAATTTPTPLHLQSSISSRLSSSQMIHWDSDDSEVKHVIKKFHGSMGAPTSLSNHTHKKKQRPRDRKSKTIKKLIHSCSALDTSKVPLTLEHDGPGNFGKASASSSSSGLRKVHSNPSLSSKAAKISRTTSTQKRSSSRKSKQRTSRSSRGHSRKTSGPEYDRPMTDGSTHDNSTAQPQSNNSNKHTSLQDSQSAMHNTSNNSSSIPSHSTRSRSASPVLIGAAPSTNASNQDDTPPVSPPLPLPTSDDDEQPSRTSSKHERLKSPSGKPPPPINNGNDADPPEISPSTTPPPEQRECIHLKSPSRKPPPPMNDNDIDDSTKPTPENNDSSSRHSKSPSRKSLRSITGDSNTQANDNNKNGSVDGSQRRKTSSLSLFLPPPNPRSTSYYNATMRDGDDDDDNNNNDDSSDNYLRTGPPFPPRRCLSDKDLQSLLQLATTMIETDSTARSFISGSGHHQKQQAPRNITHYNSKSDSIVKKKKKKQTKVSSSKKQSASKKENHESQDDAAPQACMTDKHRKGPVKIRSRQRRDDNNNSASFTGSFVLENEQDQKQDTPPSQPFKNDDTKQAVLTPPLPAKSNTNEEYKMNTDNNRDDPERPSYSKSRLAEQNEAPASPIRSKRSLRSDIVGGSPGRRRGRRNRSHDTNIAQTGVQVIRIQEIQAAMLVDRHAELASDQFQRSNNSINQTNKHNTNSSTNKLMEWPHEETDSTMESTNRCNDDNNDDAGVSGSGRRAFYFDGSYRNRENHHQQKQQRKARSLSPIRMFQSLAAKLMSPRTNIRDKVNASKAKKTDRVHVGGGLKLNVFGNINNNNNNKTDQQLLLDCDVPFRPPEVGQDTSSFASDENPMVTERERRRRSRRRNRRNKSQSSRRSRSTGRLDRSDHDLSTRSSRNRSASPYRLIM